MESPEELLYPLLKKNFMGYNPCGVSANFSDTARPTVVGCSWTMSATSCIVMGRKASAPDSKNLAALKVWRGRFLEGYFAFVRLPP